MASPILVVSDPPHGEVDLEAAAELLELDPFAARLKASFAAPEVMAAADPQGAADFATALGRTGFNVTIVDGAALAEIPWPEPVSALAFDVSSLQATMGNESVKVAYDAPVVGVLCRPPAERGADASVELDRAVASGHGPTIADAIQRRSILDLYLDRDGTLRRVTIVPDLLRLDVEEVLGEVHRRFKGLRLDTRLEGVRPRAAYVPQSGFDGSERRRYSFGTLRLREVLESIAPELRAIPQWEFGSRLAYALSRVATKAE